VSFTSWIFWNVYKYDNEKCSNKTQKLKCSNKRQRSYVNFFAKVQMLKQNKEAYIHPRKNKKEKKLAPS
jgi:hypothetical protein